MLTKQYKAKNNAAFKAGENFGLGTIAALIIFYKSATALATVIRSQLLTIEGDDDALDWDSLAVRHMVFLDSMSKLMMLAEALLSICCVLTTDGRRAVPSSFTGYHSPDITGFIRELLSGRYETSPVKIRQVFGLPAVESFDANVQDAKVIDEIFDRYTRFHLGSLKTVAQYYNDHRIAYNKLKHGLCIIAGMKLHDAPAVLHLPSTAVWILDKKDRPPSVQHAKASLEALKPYLHEWVNTLVLLPYDKDHKQGLRQTVDLILQLCWIVVNNQLLWAENCGSNFFPVDLKEGKPVFQIPAGIAKNQNELQLYMDVVKRQSHETAFYDSRSFQSDIGFSQEALRKLQVLFDRYGMAVVYYMDEPGLPSGHSEITQS
jgi:hypothetical protein